MFQFAVSLIPGVLFFLMGVMTLTGEVAAHRGYGLVSEVATLMMGSLKVSAALIAAVLSLLMAYRFDVEGFFTYVLGASVFCFFILSGVVDLLHRKHRGTLPEGVVYLATAMAFVARILSRVATEDPKDYVAVALVGIDAAVALLFLGQAFAPRRLGLATVRGACLILDGTANLHASILVHHHAHTVQNPAHLSWLTAQFLWHVLAAMLVLLVASLRPQYEESFTTPRTPKSTGGGRLRAVRNQNPFCSFFNTNGEQDVVISSNPLYQSLTAANGNVESL